MDYINSFLWAIGCLSTIVGIIRTIWVFALSNTEWVNNVTIKELGPEDYAGKGPLGDAIFPVFYDADSNDYSQRFLVRPNNVIIKKMKLVKLIYNEDFDVINRETIKVFKEVSPFRPLVIKTELPELIPKYSLIWQGDYGIKTEYVFSMNGRDGNNDRLSGFKCEYGFTQKLRKVFGLK